MITLADIDRNISCQVIEDLEVGKTIEGDKLVQLMYTGLFEEVGEVAGIFKRRIRQEKRDEIRATDDKLIEELGDVLWYYVGLCYSLGFDLEDIYIKNVNKLGERYGRTYKV